MFMKDHRPKFYNIEELLPGYEANFRKWNNNYGYVNEEYFSSLLDAFSHWTYVITEGYLIVVDLQGIEENNQFILTDPSINCIEPQFGRTNMGDTGIDQFFKTHRCGSVCEAMKLPKNNFMRSQIRRLGECFQLIH